MRAYNKNFNGKLLSYSVSVKLTEEDIEDLNYICSEMSMGRSEACRAALRHFIRDIRSGRISAMTIKRRYSDGEK